MANRQTMRLAIGAGIGAIIGVMGACARACGYWDDVAILGGYCGIAAALGVLNAPGAWVASAAILPSHGVVVLTREGATSTMGVGVLFCLLGAAMLAGVTQFAGMMRKWWKASKIPTG